MNMTRLLEDLESTERQMDEYARAGETVPLALLRQAIALRERVRALSATTGRG